MGMMILTTVFWVAGSKLEGGSCNLLPTWRSSAGRNADRRLWRRLVCRCTLCEHSASCGRYPWRRRRLCSSTMWLLLSAHCCYWPTLCFSLSSVSSQPPLHFSFTTSIVMLINSRSLHPQRWNKNSVMKIARYKLATGSIPLNCAMPSSRSHWFQWVPSIGLRCVISSTNWP